MTNRTTDAYESVFEYIHEKLFSLKANAIITDFERALRNGLRAVVPDTTLLGCWFHHCQALRRKMASICDLFSLIRKNTEAQKIYRTFQCLALLPAEKIEAAFDQIAYKALQKFPEFEKFITYYMQQWIKKEKPENYSVFLQVFFTAAFDLFAYKQILFLFRFFFHRIHVQLERLKRSMESAENHLNSTEVYGVSYLHINGKKFLKQMNSKKMLEASFKKILAKRSSKIGQC